MSIRLTLTFICLLCLSFPFETFGQNKKSGASIQTPMQQQLIAVADADAVKITAEQTVLPKNFRGHDETVLFKNLSFLIGQKQSAKNVADSKMLKGKNVYGKLTADDLFAFSDYAVSPVQGVAARSAENEKFHFYGDLWRLRSADEFPEPRLRYIDGCGSGGNGMRLKTASSRNELVTLLTGGKSSAEIWRESTFHLRTELPETVAADYTGYKGEKSCAAFYVPSPQTHYDLAFTGEQPPPLVKIEDNAFSTHHGKSFSLDDYDYKKEYGAGFAVWDGDDVVAPEKRRNLSTLFVVRLAAPYAAAKTFTKQDPIEKKPHIAVQNKIYVRIVGVWLYNRETGEIVSKRATF